MILAVVLLALLAVAPAAGFTAAPSSSHATTTSLQALSLERFREDSRYKSPYRYRTGQWDDDRQDRRALVNPRNDVYDRYSSSDYRPRYDDEYRRTHAYGVQRGIVNPRNDVYNPSYTVTRPRYDDDYRRQSYTSRRGLANPRNDVYARGVDRATETMVDHELSKIQAMGKYAIQNELAYDYGLTPRYNLTNYELACLLLQARLSSPSYNNRRRRVNSPMYSDGNPGSWAHGTGMRYDWRN